MSIERTVACPFSFVADEAHLLFPLLERANGVRVPFRALGLPFPGALAHSVSTTFRRERDLTELGRLHDELAFDWNAHAFWLPDFCGVVRFRIEALRTRIILRGRYVPPFGYLGRLFDRVAGRRLAQATAADIVERLATELEARWTAERSAERNDTSKPPA